MPPSGTDKIDVVVNGLPASWSGMARATARYLIGVLSGNTSSCPQVLGGVQIDTPRQRADDPMAARFDPAVGAITVAA